MLREFNGRLLWAFLAAHGELAPRDYRSDFNRIPVVQLFIFRNEFFSTNHQVGFRSELQLFHQLFHPHGTLDIEFFCWIGQMNFHNAWYIIRGRKLSLQLSQGLDDERGIVGRPMPVQNLVFFVDHSAVVKSQIGKNCQKNRTIRELHQSPGSVFPSIGKCAKLSV